MSQGQVEKVKELLAQEPREAIGGDVGILPITHNQGFVMLQLTAWAIVLNDDGTWFWEATDGG